MLDDVARVLVGPLLALTAALGLALLLRTALRPYRCDDGVWEADGQAIAATHPNGDVRCVTCFAPWVPTRRHRDCEQRECAERWRYR